MCIRDRAKILRLLQEKSIERLGGRDTIPVDVRILAATNRDLESALDRGKFREDLYFRLKVVTIWLPPLRERKDDIPLLTEYFLSIFSADSEIANPGITKEATALLCDYHWPGNVRELANTIQKALIFNRGGPIGPADITQAICKTAQVHEQPHGADIEENIKKWIHEAITSEQGENMFESCIDRFGSMVIGEALKLTGGNRSKAARLLGLSRPTLHAKIEKYGLKMETSVKSD